MCALAQAGLKRQEFPHVMLLALTGSRCWSPKELGNGFSSAAGAREQQELVWAALKHK